MRYIDDVRAMLSPKTKKHSECEDHEKTGLRFCVMEAVREKA